MAEARSYAFEIVSSLKLSTEMGFSEISGGGWRSSEGLGGSGVSAIISSFGSMVGSFSTSVFSIFDFNFIDFIDFLSIFEAAKTFFNSSNDSVKFCGVLFLNGDYDASLRISLASCTSSLTSIEIEGSSYFWLA